MTTTVLQNQRPGPLHPVPLKLRQHPSCIKLWVGRATVQEMNKVKLPEQGSSVCRIV